MKLTGEMKLTYKAVEADLEMDPYDLGHRMLSLLDANVEKLEAHRIGTIAHSSYAVVDRPVGAPGVCPIDTVIEARVSFFEKECTCGELVSPHSEDCLDFGIKAWSRERAA